MWQYCQYFVSKLPISIRYQVPLLLFLLVEIGFLTFWRGVLEAHLNALVIFLSGILIGCHPIYIAWRGKIALNPSHGFQAPSFNRRIIVLVVTIIGLAIISLLFYDVIHDSPILATNSDIIPTIQTLANRFVQGEDVYAPIQYEGYEVNSGYLTFHWLPFTLSEVFNIDPRVFAFIALGLTLIPVQYLIYQQGNIHIYESILKASIPLLVITSFLVTESQIFRFTVEHLFASYYILLVVGLYQRSYWLLLPALMLCLLSRYSLVLWLPLFVIMLYQEKGVTTSVGIVVFLVGAVFFMYILPFVINDPSIINNHFGKATGEWDVSGDGKPFHLFRGVGFASYFYDFAPGDIEQRLSLNQSFHKVISVLSLVICIGFYLRYRSYLPSLNISSILFLKIILSVFYAFIHIPYVYLHIIPILISAFIVVIIRPQPVDQVDTTTAYSHP